MLKKITASVLAAGLCMGALVPIASAGVNLFKDYAQGTPIDRYTRSAGYYDCSTSTQKARCTDGFDFVGEKFTVALYFREDRLDMVALIAPYKQSLYPKVSAALAKTFNIISMENESSLIDMVTLRNTATQDEYVKKFVAFEGAALSAGDLTYSYLEVPDTAGYADVGAILAAAPEDVRRAAVRLVSNSQASSVVVRFDLPNVSYKHASTEQF